MPEYRYFPLLLLLLPLQLSGCITPARKSTLEPSLPRPCLHAPSQQLTSCMKRTDEFYNCVVTSMIRQGSACSQVHHTKCALQRWPRASLPPAVPVSSLGGRANGTIGVIEAPLAFL